VPGDTNDHPYAADLFVRDRAVYPPEPTITARWRFPFASPFSYGATAAVPNAVGWATEAHRPEICLYELELSVDGGPFTRVASHMIPSAWIRGHTPAHRYRYRVRAVDCIGRSSPYSTAREFVVAAADGSAESISYTGTWSPLAVPWRYEPFEGTLDHSLTAGDTATYSTTARRIAWIAPRGPQGGSARVYVDGAEVATVDLYSQYPNPRRVVWQGSWSTTRPRTVRVEVVSGRVDVDAFAALR
jgi:hypothetical protein